MDEDLEGFDSDADDDDYDDKDAEVDSDKFAGEIMGGEETGDGAWRRRNVADLDLIFEDGPPLSPKSP